MTPPRLRSRAFPAIVAALATIVAAALTAGCGSDRPSPVEVRLKEDTKKETVLGFPALATKNTTRVGGEDAVADAAAAATAVYPGRTATTRPRLVSLVDSGDWRSSIAASVLMAPPLRAPVLFGSRDDVPDATSEVLDTLKPRGSPEAKGAQVLRVGDVAAPDGVRTTSVSGRNAYALAESIDLFLTEAAGQPSPRVVIASADDKAFAMPTAAWAAKSGDPVLFAHETALPSETVRAIKRHEQPSIYVLGPRTTISDKVVKQLQRLGDVKRIAGRTPVENAIAFARY